MFLRRLKIERINADGVKRPVPLRHLDSFAMRNFTNDAVYDDTLPVSEGRLEAGLLVPVDPLCDAMTAWFRRKGYLKQDETLRITEASGQLGWLSTQECGRLYEARSK